MESYIKSQSGFYNELDKMHMLATEAGFTLGRLPEWQKHVVLLMDEIKVKESLVYDKHSKNIIGFTDIGEINNQLLIVHINTRSGKETFHTSSMIAA